MKTVLMEVVGGGVALGVGVGVGVDVGVGVGVEVEVGVGVCEENSPVKLIESRYTVAYLWLRLCIAMPLMWVALALRSDKGISYTFQLPGAGSPP